MNSRFFHPVLMLAFGSAASAALSACSNPAQDVTEPAAGNAPVAAAATLMTGSAAVGSGGAAVGSGGTAVGSGSAAVGSGGAVSPPSNAGGNGQLPVRIESGGAMGTGGSAGIGGSGGGTEIAGSGGVAAPPDLNSGFPEDGLMRDPDYSAGNTPLPTSDEDYPANLSETGLYADTKASVFAADVRLFKPQFELWSDSAEKRRWFYLPEGEQINTADMNNWEFPVGTKVWKEFVRGNTRVETRILWRFKPGRRGWVAVSYIWKEDQSDAIAAPLGLLNASNTEHDVPAVEACAGCHADRKDFLLGFSAIQLAHDGEGLTLSELSERGLLTHPPTEEFEVPGLEVERQALGYLHANCGNCHRDRTSAAVRADLRMWLLTDQLDAVTSTDAYTYLVNQKTASNDSILEDRIIGQAPEKSEMLRRMQVRGGEDQMPPVGSEDQDEAGMNILKAWINLLPAQ